MLPPIEPAVSTHPPLFIILNTGSGRKDAEDTEAVIRGVLTQAGRAHRLWRVTDAGQLAASIREAVEGARREHGMVVAAGGDGTINCVAQQVLAARCLFGVLPQGTFNYFGRTHGIPQDTAQATEVLLKGVVRPVQAGLLNDRLFLVNASLGLYPKLLEKREEHKKRFGRSRLVALFSALITLFTLPPHLVLTLEEGARQRTLHASTLVVENNRLQLQQVGVEEADAVQRGQLTAIVVQAKGALQMLSVLWAAARRKLGDAEKVTTFACTNLTVKPPRRRRIKVATDGEVTWMIPPLVFRVAPHPLLLMVPPQSATETAAP